MKNTWCKYRKIKSELDPAPNKPNNDFIYFFKHFFPPLKYWRNTESKNGLPFTLSKYINAWHYFHNNPYGNNNILVTDYYERI